MKPVVLHDQAAEELEEAVAWYEQCRSGLGGEFGPPLRAPFGEIRRTRKRARDLEPRGSVVSWFAGFPMSFSVLRHTRDPRDGRGPRQTQAGLLETAESTETNYEFQLILKEGTKITEEVANDCSMPGATTARRGCVVACRLSRSAEKQTVLNPPSAALWPMSRKPAALSSGSRSSTTRRCCRRCGVVSKAGCGRAPHHSQQGPLHDPEKSFCATAKLLAEFVPASGERQFLIEPEKNIIVASPPRVVSRMFAGDFHALRSCHRMSEPSLFRPSKPPGKSARPNSRGARHHTRGTVQPSQRASFARGFANVPIVAPPFPAAVSRFTHLTRKTPFTASLYFLFEHRGMSPHDRRRGYRPPP